MEAKVVLSYGIQNGTRFKMENNVNKQLLVLENLLFSEMAWPYYVIQGLQFFIGGDLFLIFALLILSFVLFKMNWDFVSQLHNGIELNCTTACRAIFLTYETIS